MQYGDTGGGVLFTTVLAFHPVNIARARKNENLIFVGSGSESDRRGLSGAQTEMGKPVLMVPDSES